MPVAVDSVVIDTARADGASLSCGSVAQAVVQDAGRVPPAFWSRAGRWAVALTTVLDGDDGSALALELDGSVHGTLGSADVDALAVEAARALLDGGISALEVISAGDHSVLVESFVPRPRVVIVGAGQLADAITAQAALLGWDTRVVVDADSASAALEWTGIGGSLVVLTHDRAVDVPTMAAALRTGVRYVGALGSRRTQARRASFLQELGLTEQDVARVHGPIGLDLGGGRQPMWPCRSAPRSWPCAPARRRVALKDTTERHPHPPRRTGPAGTPGAPATAQPQAGRER